MSWLDYLNFMGKKKSGGIGIDQNSVMGDIANTVSPSDAGQSTDYQPPANSVLGLLGGAGSTGAGGAGSTGAGAALGHIGAIAGAGIGLIGGGIKAAQAAGQEAVDMRENNHLLDMQQRQMAQNTKQSDYGMLNQGFQNFMGINEAAMKNQRNRAFRAAATGRA